MEQPSGFVNQTYPSHVFLLKKAIFGLKQEPRAWFNRFSLHLLQLGFLCSYVDPSLFVLKCPQGTIILLLYVDDIVLTNDNTPLMHRFIAKITQEFAMKDLGPLHYFLGKEVILYNGGLFLSQAKYFAYLLTNTQMLHANHVNTPLAMNHNPHLNKASEVNRTSYQSVISALQYLTLTHLDITHAINWSISLWLIQMRRP